MTTDCLSDRSWWLAVFLYEKLEVHCIYTPNEMECESKIRFILWCGKAALYEKPE
jgi:hypothetical protein